MTRSDAERMELAICLGDDAYWRTEAQRMMGWGWRATARVAGYAGVFVFAGLDDRRRPIASVVVIARDGDQEEAVIVANCAGKDRLDVAHGICADLIALRITGWTPSTQGRLLALGHLDRVLLPCAPLRLPRRWQARQARRLHASLASDTGRLIERSRAGAET